MSQHDTLMYIINGAAQRYESVIWDLAILCLNV